MKTLLFLSAIVVSLAANSQISRVSIQASGLTCSMCSNAINKSLKTIDFVESVHPDNSTSTFQVSFKTGSQIDFEELKKKVEDAGFTVSRFVATINFDNVQVANNQPVKVGNKTFYFTNLKEQSINGVHEVQIVDKGFVSGKEYRKSSPAIAGGKGVYNAVVAGV